MSLAMEESHVGRQLMLQGHSFVSAPRILVLPGHAGSFLLPNIKQVPQRWTWLRRQPYRNHCRGKAVQQEYSGLLKDKVDVTALDQKSRDLLYAQRLRLTSLRNRHGDATNKERRERDSSGNVDTVDWNEGRRSTVDAVIKTKRKNTT